MSKLFLWKLGDFDHGIVPTRNAINTLTHHVQNVAKDLQEKKHAHLIWGADLNLEVFDVDDDAKHVVISVSDLENGKQVINLEEEDEAE